MLIMANPSSSCFDAGIAGKRSATRFGACNSTHNGTVRTRFISTRDASHTGSRP